LAPNYGKLRKPTAVGKHKILNVLFKKNNKKEVTYIGFVNTSISKTIPDNKNVLIL